MKLIINCLSAYEKAAQMNYPLAQNNLGKL